MAFSNWWKKRKGDRPIIKQFGDLAPNDFSQHPVWASCHTLDYGEPWYDETDEESFRPWTGALPVGPEEGMLLVRATFKLSDGRPGAGFVTPQHQQDSTDLGVMQPILFLASGESVSFWHGIRQQSEKERSLLYQHFGTDRKRIFPIAFAAENGLATGRVSGVIPGFCWCPKDTVEVYF